MDTEHDVWQGRISPDGRWVTFNAQSRKEPGVSVIGVVAASGAAAGRWTTLTDETVHADKPRWSPDGRTVYFISSRNGAFFGVWGVGFDPDRGQPVGEAFPVVRCEDPGLTLTATGGSELGVGAHRLVVPLPETAGAI